MEIFQSPARPQTTYTSRIEGQGTRITQDYVDYTPRRLVAAASPAFRNIPNLDSNPNNISYAKERRSLFYQQLALEDHSTMDYYMDSPSVRRHLGVSAQVAALNDSPPPQHNHDFEKAIRAKRNEWTITDFEVGEHLGTGKFGIVYKAREIHQNQMVALKILKKMELEAATVEPFLKREVEIQSHLKHPNIVKLYGYFHDEDNIYLVLEYAGRNNLYQVLAHYERMNEKHTVHYILAIADALKYLHSKGVLHRDIKLENILVTRDGKVKLADFGWAVFDPKPRRNTFCGTLDYLPPEMIHRQTHSHAVDVWALGIICYELLVGQPPFADYDKETEEDNHVQTYERITNARVEFPYFIRPEARLFMLKLLNKDPTKRMNILDIEKDPWIKANRV